MMLTAFQSTARFFWSRDRKVLFGFGAAYVLLFVVFQALSPEQIARNLPPALPFLRLAPFFLPLALLIGVTNATSLQLRTAEGNFPRLFFTLPIKAHEMVLPFLAYSIGLGTVLWLAGAFITNGRTLMLAPPGTPPEAETISYWIPFIATSLCSWLQAIVWTPFASTWQRVTVLIGVLLAHGFAVFLYVAGSMTQTEIIIASLLQIPIALLVAARGVARDRIGAAQDLAGPTRSTRPSRLRAFSGARGAQLWIEREIHRWNGVFIYALPLLLLAIFVALDITGLVNGDRPQLDGMARIVIVVFAWSLIAIACTTGFTFATFRARTRWQYKTAYTMPAFFAALPLSTGDFVWTKLTALTTRMLWFCAGAVLACACVASRGGLVDPADGFILSLREQHGDIAAGALLATPVIAFVLFLLSGTASTLSLTLAGREWNWINGTNAARYVLIGLGASTVGSYFGVHKTPPPGLTEIIAVLAVVKIATVIALVQYVGRRGLLSWSRLAAILGFWLATFGTLLTAGLTFMREGAISPLTLTALCLLLAPVQGTLATPIALHLNRVR